MKAYLQTQHFSKVLPLGDIAAKRRSAWTALTPGQRSAPPPRLTGQMTPVWALLYVPSMLRAASGSRAAGKQQQCRAVLLSRARECVSGTRPLFCNQRPMFDDACERDGPAFVGSCSSLLFGSGRHWCSFVLVGIMCHCTGIAKMGCQFWILKFTFLWERYCS